MLYVTAHSVQFRVQCWNLLHCLRVRVVVFGSRSKMEQILLIVNAFKYAIGFRRGFVIGIFY